MVFTDAHNCEVNDFLEVVVVISNQSEGEEEIFMNPFLNKDID